MKSKGPPARLSPEWVSRRSLIETKFSPRIGIAIFLPVPVAFYSVPLALLLAVPFWYIAWTQAKQWQQAIKHADQRPSEW